MYRDGLKGSPQVPLICGVKIAFSCLLQDLHLIFTEPGDRLLGHPCTHRETNYHCYMAANHSHIDIII